MTTPHNQHTRAAIADRCRDFPRHDDGLAPAGLKRAAVAIALVDDGAAGAALLLTRRAANLRTHSNQWALPGGRCDDGETAIDTALRELHEELGLPLSTADVLGMLDDYPTRSGYLITPVVAWAAEPAQLIPNPAEVASVHKIALAAIRREGVFDFTSIAESERRVIRFHHDGDYIHAPTAAMIYQFAEVLEGRVTRVADLEQPVFAWK